MPAAGLSTSRTGRIVLVLSLGILTSAEAQTVRRALPVKAADRAVSPLLDDAELHDVQFVGNRCGWAVGERGVVWRTEDGGTSWRHVSTGVDSSLRSVCFLTDRVGWVAGGGVTPHVGTTHGVLLGTSDGGETWTRLVDRSLPLLHFVQFFDLENGVLVCEANSRIPSGVMRTRDGGKNWEPIPGPAGESWRRGAFADRDVGVVAGKLGRFTSVGAGQVMPPMAGATGLRGFGDVDLQPDRTGWLAGEGGLILTTDNAGVSWRVPESELPRQLRDAMDFRAVAARGSHVWLAGLPGSVVWHSADRGRTWTSAPTGSPAPLSALHFATETDGWAVGTMGRILRTSDGGESWQAVRGANRRAALLAVYAHESRVSLSLVTKFAQEQGYRTAVTLMARRDVGPDAERGRTLGLRLADAVAAAGGVGAGVDWAFPVAAPELDRHPRELIREWQLLTDNRLREVMLARLVVQLRTWRPDVLVVDEPPTDDATTRLLFDALKLAVVQASDNESDELATLLHLPPWQVKRAFRRLPDGSVGAVTIDAFEFLPRQGASLSMAAADATGRLRLSDRPVVPRETYALLPWEGLAEESVGRGFFAGLVLTPGGDARRPLSSINERDLESRQSLADQQRNFTAYTMRMLDDERHAAQLIGQTSDVIGEAPPAQAAVQLFRLAGEYRRRGQWEHAQTTLFEIVNRFPQEPAALDALRWLLHFSGSAEVSWQRLRSTVAGQRTEFRVDEQVVQSDVRQAIEQVRSNSESADVSTGQPSAIRQASAEVSLHYANGQTQQETDRRRWQEQAVHTAETLKRLNATYFDDPTVQFPLASLERSRKHPRQADKLVHAFLSETADGPWNRVAAGELWLADPSAVPPVHVLLCRRTAEPPYLDGRFDDPCWLRADAVPLRSDAEHQRTSSPIDASTEGGGAAVQMSYDDRFLYVAAQLLRNDGVRSTPVEMPGRTDDADLSGHDRISFLFDVDRDYVTCYRFDVDQRGWTFDACWENEAWNADRYIAVDADGSRWLVEMAIPFEELVPVAPARGETWAAGFVRVLPTVGVSSWTPQAGTVPRPETFGLLRFE